MKDFSLLLDSIGNWLNNNQGILSVVLFILTVVLAWISGFFTWIGNEVSKSKRTSKLICAWDVFPENENKEFIEYKFAPRFQNKTDEIIKDFWINFSSSGLDLTLDQTAQLMLFDGWNFRGESLHLTSKDGYKFAPQNFLQPFEITIKLKKELPQHGVWLYISYGMPGAKKIERYYRLTYKELKKFMSSNDHSSQKFLKYFGMRNNSLWKVKLYRLFTS